MKSLHIALILFLIPFLSNGQSSKKVSELLQIESDCPVPQGTKSTTPFKEPRYEEVMEEDAEVFYPKEEKTPPKVIVPPSTSTWTNQLKGFFKKNKVTTPKYKFGENHFAFNKEMLLGLYDANGKELLAPEFTHINIAPNKSFFVGKKKGGSGYNIFDKSGKAMLEKDYQYIYPPNYAFDYVVISSGGKQGVASLDGQFLIEPKYDGIQKEYNSWVFRKGKLYGALDEKGKVLIAAQYEHIRTAYTNDNSVFFLVKEKNGELSIYKKGKAKYRLGIKYKDWGVGRIFDKRYFFYNNKLIDLKKQAFILCGDKLKIERSQTALNIFSIEKNRKNYLFNYKGELLTELPISQAIDRKQFYKDHAVIALLIGGKNPIGFSNAKYGLINKESEWVMQPEMPYLQMVRDTTLFFVVRNNKMGMIDLKGNTIIPFEYLNLKMIGRKVIGYTEKKSYDVQVLDLSGKKLFKTTLKHSDIRTNSVGHEARRLSDKKRVLLDDEFNEMYDKKFNNKGRVGDDAYWIERFGQPNEYEIIDNKGQLYPIMVDGKPRTDFKMVDKIWRTPFTFIEFSDGNKFIYNEDTKKAYSVNNDLTHISDGLYKTRGLLICSIEYRKNMGLIDGFGNEVIPPAFAGVGRKGQFMTVSTKEKTYYFSSTGKELYPEYDQVSYLDSYSFLIKKDGKFGVGNHAGEIFIPVEYKSVSVKSPALFSLKTMSGKVVLMDTNGKVVASKE